MLEMTTLKMLVSRIKSETEFNNNTLEEKKKDNDDLLLLSADKIVNFFDEIYNLDIKANFTFRLNSSNIKYINDGITKCIYYDGCGAILLTSKEIRLGTEINDYTNITNIDNSGFAHGLTKGFIEKSNKEYLLKCCSEIATEFTRIKSNILNKLLINADNLLNDSYDCLNKVVIINDVLKEFTKDVTVDNSNENEKEVFAK